MLNPVGLLIPLFLLIVFIEWYVSYSRNENKYAAGNTAMNMTIGAIDQVGSLIYFVLLFFVMQFVYNHFKIFEMPNDWRQWVLAYIAVDFLSYWYHRFSHRVNILWAGHVTHHSSKYFNFSNGFRTSLFQGINRIIFWACLPIFGFSPFVLVIILKVSGVYDFLMHTEYVPKLPLIEKFLITPSLHRVHHGKNDIYIDKNYGSTFSIWDKMFGTYQAETEPVKYGIKSEYVDNNPFTAIGHYYRYLWHTMKDTPQWSNKIKLLLMPPEWKPLNSTVKQNTLSHKNYQTNKLLKKYALFQMALCVFGFITMMAFINFMTSWEIFLCAGILIFTMTQSTMILNNSLIINFAKNGYNMLITALLLALATIAFMPNSYFIYVFLFLTISILSNIYIGRQSQFERN